MAGKAQYKTRQYNLIIDHLACLGGKHTTVSKMEAHFKACGTPVGAVTIYRHLEKLAAQGRIHKYFLHGVPGACYQYLPGHHGCNSHYHLKCESCGRLIHLECEETRNFQRFLQQGHGFQANYAKTVIYGVCKNCCYTGETSHAQHIP